MRYAHYTDFPEASIGVDAPGARRRFLNDVEAAVSTSMVEVAPGGHTLRHSHPYEHTFYIIEGTGEALDENGVSPLSPGVVVYVRPGELHMLKNTGDRVLRFLDVEPARKGA